LSLIFDTFMLALHPLPINYRTDWLNFFQEKPARKRLESPAESLLERVPVCIVDRLWVT
jgi:hypothetical protein